MVGGMGDEIIGAPGSFSTWNVVDQMNFELHLDDRVRRRRETKLAEEVVDMTVEKKGEEDD